MPEGKKPVVPAPAASAAAKEDSYSAKTHLHQPMPVTEMATVAATALPANAPEGTLPSEVRPEIVTWEKLVEAIKASGKAYNMAMIEKAYNMANDAHKGVCRRSGEPYICHPLAVARLVLDLGMDSESIAAALLHDVVEDTPTTLTDLTAAFGEEVAALVDGVTKLTKIQFSNIEELQAENLRKMLLAMSRDVRVMIIKLCDRLHNMRTGDAWPEQKRRDKARETMEVYAPIANRLGILNVKEELEDRSLHYLDPVGYEEINKMLSERAGDEFLASVSGVIKSRLEESGIEGATIKRRVKSIYGIYRKTIMQNKSFDEIYDIYAVRIILDTLAECYSTLGLIHDMYHPLPNRFKDYISTPKPNGYQSLHTTVIGHEGIPFEVQIRTERMDAVAERGIAAHWRYKGVNQGAQTSEMWLGHLRELIEDTTHSLAQRFDAKPASGEIFVFTPNGDLRKLPEGATLLDFAFDIHTSLGSTCVGGRVNGRAVPIREQLRNGDIVEITTQKNQTPKSDWLSLVVTSKARNKIKSYLREEQAKHTRMGREELERKLKNWKFAITIDEAVAYLAKYFKLRLGTEVYALIATQKLDFGSIKEILSRHLSGEAEEERRAAAAEIERQKAALHGTQEKAAPQDALVIDDDISKIQYKLAKCCNPIKGDDVFGFVTISAGITIHRCDCPNAKRMRENYPYRVIDARWRQSAEGAFRVTIRIVAADTTGMANHITEVIVRDLKLGIRSMNFAPAGNGCVAGEVAVEVPGTAVVDTLIHQIMRIKGVQRAYRVN